MHILLFLAAAHAAAADCEPLSTTALSHGLASAEALVLAGDVHTFQATVDTLLSDLPCADHVLDAPQAARLHRLVGLRAAVDQDNDAARAAFTAALTLDPDAPLLANGTEPGASLAALYSLPDDVSVTSLPANVPPGTTLFVDGTERTAVPASRPYIAQWSQAHTIGPSAYVLDGLAGLPTAPMPAPQAPGPSRRRQTLLWSAVGSAVAAAGLQAGARVVHKRAYAGQATDLDAVQPTVNGLSLSSAGLGLAATGLGVAWALEVRR